MDAVLICGTCKLYLLRQVRDKVCVGFIKDTPQHGNTSVSMGAAKALSANLGAGDYIGFLNCGTGGIKYQMYKREPLLSVAKEYKPSEEKHFANLGQLELGSYKPPQDAYQFVTSMEDFQSLFKQELKNAPWAGKPEIPVYAFITGKIRAHWEKKADAKERDHMNGELQAVFKQSGIEPLPASLFGGNQTSYFITQEQVTPSLLSPILHRNLFQCLSI